MKNEVRKVTVADYVEEVTGGKVSLSVSVQRGDDKWTLQQKSKLIESVLKGYPVPEICVANYEGASVVIDGLQRTTALKAFLNDEFALEGVEDSICGKTFSQLDDMDKQKFRGFELNIMDAGEVSGVELQELFLRLNNGTALSKTQKTRGYLGDSIATWAKDMCNHSLFTKLTTFTARQQKDDAPLECLLQGIMLIHGCLGDRWGDLYSWKNISRDEVQQYCKDFLSNASEDELGDYKEVIEYLDSDAYEGAFSKTFVPTLIVVAKYAMLSGVSKKDFEEYMKELILKKPAGYKKNQGAGNVSKKMTVGRVGAMIDDFNKQFPDVDKPNICLDDSRKKKVTKAMRTVKSTKSINSGVEEHLEGDSTVGSSVEQEHV